MPLLEDILAPIPGDNPSGANLRFSPVYDRIKEARREDDDLAQGVWQRERKTADHGEAIRLIRETLAKETKDLQLAVWLTDSLLKRDGFRGFREGIDVCSALVDAFWDTLHPEIEDGDVELRAAPLVWLGSKLDIPIRSVPLCNAGFNYLQYKDSRNLGYEEAGKSNEQKAAREKAVKAGRLAPEVFDKAFGETPKQFYVESEKNLDTCTVALDQLGTVCDNRFGDDAPTFGKLKDAIAEVRVVVHSLLQKKREIEPDPPEPEPESAPEAETLAVAAGAGASGGAATATSDALPVAALSWPPRTGGEPQGVREAVESIAAAAAFLRKRDPFSPAPYLMLRGLRWGELRASSDPAILEPPPTELRRQVKTLALDRRWAELLELSEAAMSLPCSRAWLDLQRFVIEACAALGEKYDRIAVAVRSEIRALLRDLPMLLDATLSDDTPAANAETRAWLLALLAEPAARPQERASEDGRAGAPPAGWQKKYLDANVEALEALRSGQPQKAVETLQREVEKQTSGRGRFFRKLQLAQICSSAGKESIAQPLIDDLMATIDAHKLDDWEDRATVAAALVFLMQASKKIQADAKLKQAMFERVCRLDPVSALSI